MNEKNINAFYTFLQSQQTAQQYLFHCYQNKGIVDAKAKSYQNCNSFIYYLKHGLHFYESGKQLTTILQPILFFYGMVHLLKAALLTKRPNYPETTKLLAHGVSSRKRKKKDYTFMDDEIKSHFHGLFPYFSEHLFSIKKLPINQYKMNYLFALIPEMNTLFNFNNQNKVIVIGKMGEKTLTFPIDVLDHYYLTSKAFLERMHVYLPQINKKEVKKNKIQIELSSPLKKSSGPFFFDFTEQMICFPINREHFLPISEVMVHYLILYNLSMLSRYETEWWGDLISSKPEIDYPFIKHFLHITSKKVPLLIGNDLLLEHLQH